MTRIFVLLMVGMIVLSNVAVAQQGDKKASAGAAECPSVATIQEFVNNTFSRPLKVEKVIPGPVKGLCQVEVKLGNQSRVIYSDKTGQYILLGEVYRTKDGENITKNTVVELNRFTDDELKRLDDLSAFSIGEKGPVVYLVTDPQCPYCKKAEAIIEEMAGKGQVHAKIILFPLRFHKGAKEESISIICDNKGLEGLKNRYRSDNQCETGVKKVNDTIQFLQSKGITGTPTYIFKNGRYHSGVLKAEALKKQLAR